MTFISYAQNFEDVMLWRALGTVKRGFYIDVGAAHPDTDSVTRSFYDRGWHGINIEPVEDDWRRLVASRPRDVNLRLALAATAGQGDFFVVPGTGLSTLRESALSAVASGRTVMRTVTNIATLAQICRQHAPIDIQFLKIDVEGAERDVLLGADFQAFRPWIVLVEATAPTLTVEVHNEWEQILLDADYIFVWFDGLNRFYIAAERHGELAPAFTRPPNVFDNFLRAADTEWTRRIHEAETRAEAFQSRASAAEARADAGERRFIAQEVELQEAQVALWRTRTVAARQTNEIAAMRSRQRAMESHVAALNRHLAVMRRHVAEVQKRAMLWRDWLSAVHASSSWRLTAPVRWLIGRRDAAVPDMTPIKSPALLAPRPRPHTPVTPIENDAMPQSAPRLRPARRAVHQFHSGSSVGDAITNAMMLTRTLLRQLGYDSEIFVEHVSPGLRHELRPYEALPRTDDYVLILRHSMGYDAFQQIAALPAPKVLIYHNITPPEFLGDDAFVRYAALGRKQLVSLRDEVVAALADSEYNALELRRLGFPAPRACPLLFDVDDLITRAAQYSRARDNRVFTVLFVGRIIGSKAQLDLVEAFARFHAAFAHPSRLVLVGRSDSDSYLADITGRIRAHGLDANVTLTGLAPDDALHRWYAGADLYVSLSRHEGFGVPFVEAMAHGVPVLAWPSGAVPYTLGEGAELLVDRSPQSVADRMLELARDPVRRGDIVARQRRSLRRFARHRQLPHLRHALALAGAAPPEHADTADLFAANMRFTVVGHVNKNYSLAAINRAVALALESERPGRVRLVPVEGEPTSDLSEVPSESRAEIAVLAARPPHATGPDIVISQHYPLYVPAEPGDAPLALFFWEESVVPAETVARLNHSFRAVLTASRFVAKALIDSGVSLPVHVVGHAPDLEGFRALAQRRSSNLAVGRGDVFTFLHVSSCFPRKGVDVLLSAYASAFRRGDRVRLVLKGFPNPHNDVAAQLARLRAQDPDVAAIELIDRELDASELLALYADADVLVLPTRGEGLNLPA
ncbi:MAG: FkbM family methyltransferase, partial [Acetobacteraceae bacterium]|nr:FkbM family methyltransferase [Acetobacteraceae bacterium]